MAVKKKTGFRKRKVPKKQIDNPGELHPTPDGILRITKENAPMAQAMMMSQVRDSSIRVESLLTQLIKEIKEIKEME